MGEDSGSQEGGGVTRRIALEVLGGGIIAATGIPKAEAQRNPRLPPELTPAEREIVERLVRRSGGLIVDFGKVTRSAVLALSPLHPQNPDGTNAHPDWCCGIADCRFAEYKLIKEAGLEGYAVGIHLNKGEPVFAFFKGEPNLRHNEVPKMLSNEAQACITKNPPIGGKEQLGNPFCLYTPRVG